MGNRRPDSPREANDPSPAPSEPRPPERCPRCNGLDQVPVVTPSFIMSAWFACPHCNHVWGVPRTDG